MNKEFHEKHRKRAMIILSKQPKMSLAEKIAQSERVLGTTNQAGNPYQEKNSETTETENPQPSTETKRKEPKPENVFHNLTIAEFLQKIRDNGHDPRKGKLTILRDEDSE